MIFLKAQIPGTLLSYDIKPPAKNIDMGASFILGLPLLLAASFGSGKIPVPGIDEPRRSRLLLVFANGLYFRRFQHEQLHQSHRKAPRRA